MHIIFKLRIGFMIVKRETWLNNTQRYRAHIYIYNRDYVGIMEKKMETTTGFRA